MKSRFALNLFLIIFMGIAGAGCIKKINFPWPGKDEKKKEETKTKEDLNKLKEKYFKKISEYDFEHAKLSDKQARKRADGYNTSDAEQKLPEMKALTQTAYDHVVWNRFELADEDLSRLKALKKEIKKAIKKAPKIGGENEKNKKFSKWKDDRDIVAERYGEPAKPNMKDRGFTPITFNIHNPTPLLLNSNSICVQQLGRSVRVTFGGLTDITEWYYPDEGLMFIFMPVPSGMLQLMSRNELNLLQRDQAILQICQQQAMQKLTLIYAGPPGTDMDLMIQQLFTGVGRGADMFGTAGFERVAWATASLGDLYLASIVFNTEAERLNRIQNNQWQLIFGKDGLFERTLPDFIIAVKKSVGIISSGKPRKEIEKALKELLKEYSGDERKLIDAVSNVAHYWQKDLRYSKKDDIKDIEKYLKKYGKKSNSETKFLMALNEFKRTLENLSSQWDEVEKELLKLRDKYFPRENIFEQGDHISIFFMVENARFKKETINGKKVDVPDITLDISAVQEYDKKEPPLVVSEKKEIKITNPRVRSDREKYSRLVSFGINFKIMLYPSTYTMNFTIKDNISGQTITQSIQWVIIKPPEDKN